MPMIFFLAVLCTVFIFHGTCSLFWLLYAWQDRQQIEKEKTPATFAQPLRSFTALVPARHEATVIAQTITSIDAMEYPEELKEIIVICRFDDTETIASVQKTIAQLGKDNIRLVIFEDTPINKPHALNIGFNSAQKNTIVIFDAEDQPHARLYQIANTIMCRNQLHVLQSGVQLMNYRSHWFSTLNVLEYFFWFKSTMHYFAKQGVIPLGGNTIFFDKAALQVVGGWDETCLTEDADIGIRLSILGAKIGVTYEEKYVTQEETPSSINQFIKQRTRWNQGFLEILLKRDWLKLPGLYRKLLSMYIFITPYAQTVFFLFILLSLYLLFTISLPIWLVLYLTVPLCLLVLQLLTLNIGLFLFCQAYKKPFYIWLPLKILLTFFLYQFLLGISSCRALLRTMTRTRNWEKTLHLNAHRQVAEVRA